MRFECRIWVFKVPTCVSMLHSTLYMIHTLDLKTRAVSGRSVHCLYPRGEADQLALQGGESQPNLKQTPR